MGEEPKRPEQEASPGFAADESQMSLWERYQQRVHAVQMAKDRYYGSESIEETTERLQILDASQAALNEFVETLGVPEEPRPPEP